MPRDCYDCSLPTKKSKSSTKKKSSSSKSRAKRYDSYSDDCSCSDCCSYSSGSCSCSDCDGPVRKKKSSKKSKSSYGRMSADCGPCAPKPKKTIRKAK